MSALDFDAQLYGVEKMYFEGCDISYIADLLRSNVEITPRTRSFIADILEGKIKRKRGGRNQKHERDFEIACKVYSLLNEGKPLTSSRNPGAAELIASEYFISTDAVIKIYQKKWPELEQCIQIDNEAWQEFMESNPDLFP